MTRNDIEKLNAADVGDVVTMDDGRLVGVEGVVEGSDDICAGCVFNTDGWSCTRIPCLATQRKNERPVRFIDVTPQLCESVKPEAPITSMHDPRLHQKDNSPWHIEVDYLARSAGYVKLEPGQVVVPEDALTAAIEALMRECGHSCDKCGGTGCAVPCLMTARDEYDRLTAAIEAAKIGEKA